MKDWEFMCWQPGKWQLRTRS